MAQTFAANFTRLFTSAPTNAVGLTFTFADTSDAPAVPFYAVLAVRDDTKREVVKFSTKTSTTLVADSISDRYLAGSSAGSGIDHPSNTEVLLAPLAQHLDDIWSGLAALEVGDLADVDVSAVGDGDALVFDAGTSEWVPGSAGAKGAGGDRIFWENDQTVTTSYAVTSGQNAMTAGPIEIDVGVTVTVPAGSEWTIV
jgi:hypothetical protein